MLYETDGVLILSCHCRLHHLRTEQWSNQRVKMEPGFLGAASDAGMGIGDGTCLWPTGPNQL